MSHDLNDWWFGLKYQIFATYEQTIYLGEFDCESEEDAGEKGDGIVNDELFSFLDYEHADRELVEVIVQPVLEESLKGGDDE